MVTSDKVTFSNSFKGQRTLRALVGKPVDIDKKITIRMKPMEVIVLEGVCEAGKQDDTEAKPAPSKSTMNKGRKKND